MASNRHSRPRSRTRSGADDELLPAWIGWLAIAAFAVLIAYAAAGAVGP